MKDRNFNPFYDSKFLISIEENENFGRRSLVEMYPEDLRKLRNEIDAVLERLNEKSKVVEPPKEDVWSLEQTILVSGVHGECKWQIGDKGTLTIYPADGVSGELASKECYNKFESPWIKWADSINKVVVEHGVTAPENITGMFAGLHKCKEIDLFGFNTSKAHSFDLMFAGCKSLEKLDLSFLNVDNVWSTYRMCENCVNLKEIRLGAIHEIAMLEDNKAFVGCKALEGRGIKAYTGPVWQADFTKPDFTKQRNGYKLDRFDSR